MPTKIIGIHGLANKPEKKVLARWWNDAIREGLQKNQKKNEPNFEFKLVFWADLLYKNQQHDNVNFNFDPLYNTQPYIAAESGSLKLHKDNWVDGLRKVTERTVGNTLDYMDRHFGWDAVAKLVIEKTIRDLDFYYDRNRKIADRNGEMRIARKVLMDELKGELLGSQDDGSPVVLVAHSMGSIIAYDVLREIGSDDDGFVVDHFVTIGSPLGLPVVKHNVQKLNDDRPSEDWVRTPTVVTKDWLNLADRRDPVCLDNHLSDEYGPNKHRVQVEDDIILNDYVGLDGDSNPHKSYGYLRTPEFSAFLAQLV